MEETVNSRMELYRNKALALSAQTSNNRAEKFFDSRIAVLLSEAAFFVGINERTMRGILKKGALPYTKIGNKILIKISDIDTWLSKRETL